ncbi:hypothetical protein EYF80_017410 [Liparis tanakae]|uniref:Uncharacterized protein n=1 Tax=Liparis tanakae TaxID=230148 RepID=A0A4Z2I3N7_9TELE|nr:hypothetical protein EYF80_017410 [Liparis tanakae]
MKSSAGPVTAAAARSLWNLKPLSCLTSPFSAGVSGYGLMTRAPGLKDIRTGPDGDTRDLTSDRKLMYGFSLLSS